MLKDYLKKFKKLSKELRDEVSSPEAVKILEGIERKYSLALAKVVILIMIKEVRWNDLGDYLQKEFKIEIKKAEAIKSELREKIFKGMMGYLEQRSQKPVISPQPPVPSPQPSAMVLDLEEEEIEKQVRPNLEQIRKEKELEKIAEELVRESDLGFEDETAKKRFKNIILTQLRGVRTSIETKETLMRPKERGGMGMSEEAVEKINQKLKIKNQGYYKEEKKGQGGMEKINQKLKIKSQKYGEELNFKETTSSTPPTLSTIPPLAIPPAPSTIEISRTVESPGPKIEDIKSFKKIPQLIGPIEELRGLKLGDWRGLADTPKERINKIKEKIELIGEESIERKAQAIKAWKENEITQLYLKIGRESMEQNKSIAEVITERSQAGRPSLNMEEFGVIADLNQLLRF